MLPWTCLITDCQQDKEIPMVHDRVEAAAVYGRDGKKIGTIERLMLEKKTGTVAYAVVKCDSFLKGDAHHYLY
jgi:sporulation protein YlmC with PRC-barrel domain